MRAYSVTALLPQTSTRHDEVELEALLDDLLSTKLVGMLRGRRHHFMARRNSALHATDMFLAHSNAEQRQADAIAWRMVELNAAPGFAPAALVRRSHAAFFDTGARVADMAREDLDALRVTDHAVTGLLRYVEAGDAATRKLLNAILLEDRARARTLSNLVASLEGT